MIEYSNIKLVINNGGFIIITFELDINWTPLK